uniref:RBR-type E3 ubiquitin transferase n=1 Tax=Stegastes partitus TaxID=144197 RepID=A0A3B5ANT7_9TELE
MNEGCHVVNRPHADSGVTEVTSPTSPALVHTGVVATATTQRILTVWPPVCSMCVCLFVLPRIVGVTPSAIVLVHTLTKRWIMCRRNRSRRLQWAQSEGRNCETRKRKSYETREEEIPFRGNKDSCLDGGGSRRAVLPVRVAKALISCPIPECSGSLDEGVVVSHLAAEELAKYRYFLELSQLDSSTKPCPQCSEFTSLKSHGQNRSEHKYKIQCSSCQFVWCFKCHAPWHNGLKCRDYRKGDKLLRTWASVIEHGQRNAQKCPECKIHIQRTEGCDHMTCTQCNTNFCYRCGERYRHLRFFGDHTSNLSVFGCKYRYLPDKPHLRRFIRGSVCATKVLIAPVVVLLVVVLGALALVIGLVVFPVYYVCKRRKKQQRTRGAGRWI